MCTYFFTFPSKFAILDTVRSPKNFADNSILMPKYLPTIGLEVHVELDTASKMFCSCRNEGELGMVPNSQVCEVCTAQPGALPVPNARAIELVQRVGLALGCTVAAVSKFDRKNYFYPDIPKGYQISQYDEPLCEGGEVMVLGNRKRITRIHLEEDTGKLTHTGDGSSLVDFNRAGVPLMELVTEADFKTGEEARAFGQHLQRVLRYLGASNADMEKGQMRMEVNLSLYAEGNDYLSGTKVEVKNISSFRAVERAIAYEIERQTEVLNSGGSVVQETRGWDDPAGKTKSQRKKEGAKDYRYFPEPDIPPLTFTAEYIEDLKRSLPELPDAKAARFATEYGLPDSDIAIIIDDKPFADYFESVASEVSSKVTSGETKSEVAKVVRLSCNYLLTEVRKWMTTEQKSIDKFPISAENFAELMGMTADGAINSSATQTVLAEMLKGAEEGSGMSTDPSDIVARLNLAQVSDTGALQVVVDEVLAANAQSIADYRGGKASALQFLVGQVMKATKGKANPAMVTEILLRALA